jgi:hypothetical protein
LIEAFKVFATVRVLLKKVDTLERTLSAQPPTPTMSSISSEFSSTLVHHFNSFGLYKLSGTVTLLADFQEEMATKVKVLENNLYALQASNAVFFSDTSVMQSSTACTKDTSLTLSPSPAAVDDDISVLVQLRPSDVKMKQYRFCRPARADPFDYSRFNGIGDSSDSSQASAISHENVCDFDQFPDEGFDGGGLG